MPEKFLTLWLTIFTGAPMTIRCIMVAGSISKDFSDIIAAITAPDPNGDLLTEAALSPKVRLKRFLNNQVDCTYELRRGEKDWRIVIVRRQDDIYYLQDLGEAA